jgi:hypothetical protein
VNEDIRALVAGTGRPFTDSERAVFEALLVEWSLAVVA